MDYSNQKAWPLEALIQQRDSLEINFERAKKELAQVEEMICQRRLEALDTRPSEKPVSEALTA